MKNNVAIITGWGWSDYACAAAIALRKFKSADVSGMSQRKLPIHLTELSKNKKCSYNKIIVLGIGMNKAPKMLINEIEKLNKKKVEIIWISAYNIPYKLKNIVADYVEGKEESLTKTTADYFNLKFDDLIPLTFNSKNHLSGKSMEQYLLIQSAQHRYRCFQDYEAYPEVVKTLSTNTVFNNQQKMMIEFYKKYGNRELKGKSQVMMDLHATIHKIGQKDSARVLIFGETGTGKETVAIHLHERSPRREKPMITFNCASSNKNLLESHLFGHVKGAFTGAITDKKGAFEEADGGTLFLDEIAELPLETQANILRILQEGRFNKIGSIKEISVDVRIIAATNKDLPQMIREGKFREDLFYRLNVVPIHIPPLREHIEDITEIANNIWFNKGLGKLNPKKIEILKTYNWPGNVRELGNFLERAAVLEENDFAKLLNMHKKEIESMKTSEQTFPENLDELIHHQANKLYEKYGKNKVKTAEAMGITRVTLRKYLRLIDN